MKFKNVELGKVSITCESTYNPNKAYDRLCLVSHNGLPYLSKTKIDKGLVPGISNLWQLFIDPALLNINAHIEDGSITSDKFDKESIILFINDLVDGKLGNVYLTLQDNSVDSVHIKANSINRDKIQNNEVTLEKLNINVIDYIEQSIKETLKDVNISTSSDIVDNAIKTNHIEDGAITPKKLSNGFNILLFDEITVKSSTIASNLLRDGKDLYPYIFTYIGDETLNVESVLIITARIQILNATNTDVFVKGDTFVLYKNSNRIYGVKLNKSTTTSNVIDIVENSIRTEHIKNNAITNSKLSSDLQALLTKVNNFVDNNSFEIYKVPVTLEDLYNNNANGATVCNFVHYLGTNYKNNISFPIAISVSNYLAICDSVGIESGMNSYTINLGVFHRGMYTYISLKAYYYGENKDTYEILDKFTKTLASTEDLENIEGGTVITGVTEERVNQLINDAISAINNEGGIVVGVTEERVNQLINNAISTINTEGNVFITSLQSVINIAKNNLDNGIPNTDISSTVAKDIYEHRNIPIFTRTTANGIIPVFVNIVNTATQTSQVGYIYENQIYTAIISSIGNYATNVQLGYYGKDIINDDYTSDEFKTAFGQELLTHFEHLSIGGEKINYNSISLAHLTDELKEYITSSGSGGTDGLNATQVTQLINASLAGYVKENQLNNYATNDSLNNYATKNSLNDYVQITTLANYVQTTTLNNYPTSTVVDNKISSAINTAFANSGIIRYFDCSTIHYNIMSWISARPDINNCTIVDEIYEAKNVIFAIKQTSGESEAYIPISVKLYTDNGKRAINVAYNIGDKYYAARLIQSSANVVMLFVDYRDVDITGTGTGDAPISRDDVENIVNEALSDYRPEVTIGNGAVGANQLANNVVSTDKLQNGAVTNIKIGDGSITPGKTDYHFSVNHINSYLDLVNTIAAIGRNTRRLFPSVIINTSDETIPLIDSITVLNSDYDFISPKQIMIVYPEVIDSDNNSTEYKAAFITNDDENNNTSVNYVKHTDEYGASNLSLQQIVGLASTSLSNSNIQDIRNFVIAIKNCANTKTNGIVLTRKTYHGYSIPLFNVYVTDQDGFYQAQFEFIDTTYDINNSSSIEEITNSLSIKYKVVLIQIAKEGSSFGDNGVVVINKPLDSAGSVENTNNINKTISFTSESTLTSALVEKDDKINIGDCLLLYNNYTSALPISILEHNNIYVINKNVYDDSDIAFGDTITIWKTSNKTSSEAHGRYTGYITRLSNIRKINIDNTKVIKIPDTYTTASDITNGKIKLASIINNLKSNKTSVNFKIVYWESESTNSINEPFIQGTYNITNNNNIKLATLNMSPFVLDSTNVALSINNITGSNVCSRIIMDVSSETVVADNILKCD